MKTNFIYPLVGALLTYLFSSCSMNAAYVGTYIAQHEQGFESIELMPNGTFKQSFRLGSITKSSTGAWTIRHDGGGERIAVDNWVCFVDPMAPKEVNKDIKPIIAVFVVDGDCLLLYPDFPKFNYCKE